jgi:DNA polymerase III epsilon subunit-like protein
MQRWYDMARIPPFVRWASLLFVVGGLKNAFQMHMSVSTVVTIVFLAFALSGRFVHLQRQGERKIPHNDQKDQYVSIDCEMVGVGPNGRKSALARVSIVDWNLELVFDTYVQVMDRVTDYRTHVSGIRKKHLKGAMNFRLCRERVEALLRGKILVGHGLENDFAALRYIHPEEMVRDTSQYQPLQRFDCGKWKSRKLKHLVQQYLGKEDFQQGEHDSIHDARAVMELYHIFHNEWKEELQIKTQKR